MRYAIIDIGSNTVKMNLYDAGESARPECILSESRMVGLISYSAHHTLPEDGVARLCETVRYYRELAEKLSADVIRCFATASLRLIENREEVLKTVLDSTGLLIDVVSGENEALLSFRGLKLGMGPAIRSGVMIDMGGGSTELLGFVDGLAVRAVSLDFGCLSLYRQFVSELLPNKKEIDKIKKFVDTSLAAADWLPCWSSTVYVVGGTARCLGRLHSEHFHLQYSPYGYTMPSADVKEVVSRFKLPGRDELDIMIRHLPDRLHTIVPGLVAYRRIISAIGGSEVVVSETGIREGYLMQTIDNQTSGESQARADFVVSGKTDVF